MDDRTLEALKASIRKWDANAEVYDIENASLGASSCPLCQIFHRIFGGERGCVGCPVAEAGHPVCELTPYEIAEGTSDLEEFCKAARAEADFLRSLLPEGETV